MISAAIFDMDGVLIDSEPFWRKADMAVFKTVGINLTEEMCLQTMGLACIDTVGHWYQRFPWKDKDFQVMVNEIENHVIASIYKDGQKMQGVDYIIDLFKQKKIPIALASSSSMQVIEAVLDKLNLRNEFKIFHSAQFEAKGKPDPAVFLTTVKRLGVHPSSCLVFEDSVNGIKAGLAAGMKVVGVPESHMQHDERYKMANLVINSLDGFGEKEFKKLGT